MTRQERFKVSTQVISGAFAGLSVDLTLFPLDTMKTRLQSEMGFWHSGGFKKIYAGIPSVAIGSAPGAALFFTTYEGTKNLLLPFTPHPSFAHMVAASIGEVVACLIRVPTEVLKQRGQAYPKRTLKFVYFKILESEGYRGFYRGYKSTVMREIPFSFIQFPLWEAFKLRLIRSKNGQSISPFEVACCGSIAGVISAGITTPLDVAKTRIMLAEKLHGHAHGKVFAVLKDVWNVQGVRGIYAGFWPRITWMGIGGFVFFGAYELAKVFVKTLTTGDEMPLETEVLQSIPREKVNRFLLFLWTGSWKQERPKTLEELEEDTNEIKRKREDFIRRRKEYFSDDKPSQDSSN